MTNPNCNKCFGTGKYYEDVAGDGGPQLEQDCDCIVTLDAELLKAVQELKERIEKFTNIRTTVNVCLWFPPIDEVEIVGDWGHIDHSDQEDPYVCKMLDDITGFGVTLYLSKTRQDGFIK